MNGIYKNVPTMTPIVKIEGIKLNLSFQTAPNHQLPILIKELLLKNSELPIVFKKIKEKFNG